MIKAVIDTNILISGLISPKASPAKIISLWRERKFILVVSEEIIEELKSALFYPKIFKKYGLSKSTIGRYLKIIRAFAEMAKPKESVNLIIADTGDNKFLEAALAANVNFIVSGDKHLLGLKKFRGIKIIKAEEFTRIIQYGPA